MAVEGTRTPFPAKNLMSTTAQPTKKGLFLFFLGGVFLLEAALAVEISTST